MNDPTSDRGVTLEVCAGSICDAVTAEESGADRVELNAAVELGGLSPSPGTVAESAARLDIPIIAMVRPRGGGFAYDGAEFDVMRRDVEAFAAAGIAGFAFGILTEDGRIDVDRCSALIESMSGHEIVFHRAFDLTPHPADALEQLIDLGVDRVLTSGQAPSAMAGRPLLRSLVEQSGGRIEILPGGGINADNASDLVRVTGCCQVHGTFRARGDGRGPDCSTGDPIGGLFKPLAGTDGEHVRAVRDRLDAM